MGYRKEPVNQEASDIPAEIKTSAGQGPAPIRGQAEMKIPFLMQLLPDQKNEFHDNYHMENTDEVDTVLNLIQKLMREQKFGEAINYLQKLLEKDNRNEKALALMQQIKTILEYQNRDIFGSTNLDMDPWFE